jgi:hypothetical protein
LHPFRCSWKVAELPGAHAFASVGSLAAPHQTGQRPPGPAVQLRNPAPALAPSPSPAPARPPIGCSTSAAPPWQGLGNTTKRLATPGPQGAEAASIRIKPGRDRGGASVLPAAFRSLLKNPAHPASPACGGLATPLETWPVAATETTDQGVIGLFFELFRPDAYCQRIRAQARWTGRRRG